MAPRYAETPTELRTEEFLKFREFFYRATGIMFADNKRYFVDKRIRERMDAGDFTSFQAYFNAVRLGKSSRELQQLINIMTVNETHFYREEYQFRCLVTSLLPEIVRGQPNDTPVRIWSVPCSTGEEPYSIAIYMLEWWPDVDRFDVEIVASDIDTRVLQAAKRGVYAERAVQTMPRSAVTRYMRPCDDGGYEVISDIRDSISFVQANLSDPESSRGLGKFDVVFCRNLLIYFDDVSRREAAEAIYESLRPGGFVCLGHSESMSRISSLFEVRRFSDAIVYQKPSNG